jgi:hypothetical protein
MNGIRENQRSEYAQNVNHHIGTEIRTLKQWTKTVKEKDNYTCQKCGDSSKRMCAHHKKPKNKFPELRLDVSNGSTMCISCHSTLENTGSSRSERTKEIISQKRGHDFRGLKHLSEETKFKLSQNRLGELNPFYGKRHSDETKLKIQSSNRARATDEFRLKMSALTSGALNGHYGKKHSAEARVKISIKASQRVLSTETKRKIGAASKIAWANRKGEMHT